jgi:hypothetical protein
VKASVFVLAVRVTVRRHVQCGADAEQFRQSSNKSVKHSGLLSFWTFSKSYILKEHTFSETGSVSCGETIQSHPLSSIR